MIIPPQNPRWAQWEQIMGELSEAAYARYRQMVYADPAFRNYFEQATPIDLIEEFRIGSRPSTRPDGSRGKEMKRIARTADGLLSFQSLSSQL